ncbi:MAG: type 4a pilus biogenesis protein PilO [Nitrospira sp.]|nr:type 4a pilus biogenesis protein PilO [Nitrospira sp.]MCY4133028.1 type 4a pilus biogenesis protein PilO [Nitrospira sp.]
MVERILDWVEDTPKSRKTMLLLLCAGLTSIILFQFVVEPQRERGLAFQQTLRSLDHQLATSKPDRKLATLKKEIGSLTSRLTIEKKLLATSMDHMLTGIVDKAQSVDVALRSWEFEEPVPLPETNLHRVTIRLRAEGRYHALAHFLEELQTLPNTLPLKSLDFHAQERSEANPEHPVQASIELTGFQAAEVEPGEKSVAGTITG